MHNWCSIRTWVNLAQIWIIVGHAYAPIQRTGPLPLKIAKLYVSLGILVSAPSPPRVLSKHSVSAHHWLASEMTFKSKLLTGTPPEDFFWIRTLCSSTRLSASLLDYPNCAIDIQSRPILIRLAKNRLSI